jgi:hypothetical protein
MVWGIVFCVQSQYNDMSVKGSFALVSFNIRAKSGKKQQQQHGDKEQYEQ